MIFLETINILYYLVRKQHGMGRGDGMLLFVTAGVPVALTGNWVIGIYGPLLGFVLSAVGGLIIAAKTDGGMEYDLDEIDQREPEYDEDGNELSVTTGQIEFAAGPFLMAGPAIVWVVLSIGGWV